MVAPFVRVSKNPINNYKLFDQSADNEMKTDISI